MATIRQETNGRKTILVVCADQKRRSIRLGKCHMTTAKKIKTHVEALNTAVIANVPMEREQAEWLRGIGDVLHARIAKAGLCKPRNRSTLKAWIEKYLESHEVKQSTREQIEIAGDNLVTFFGAERGLDTISEHEAKEWRSWLSRGGMKKKPLARNTVRRRTGRAKQLFAAAVIAKLIEENPFGRLESATGSNESRKEFITSGTIEECLAKAPPGDWQTIIALSRYAGLRIPSELVSLRWEDVNLPEGWIRVHAMKNEHQRDGGIRYTPAFPELRPWLEKAWELAPDGAEFVIQNATYRSPRANLRTEFERIIKRAGHTPWQKLWQNLRASRETELLGAYPARDVVAWLGNTEQVAMKNYAMPRADIFRQAVAEGVPEEVKSEAAQKAAQHEAESGGTEQHAEPETP